MLEDVSMKAFKRREVTDLQHLRTLVTDNADAVEPNLNILAANLNFGRTSVELAALVEEEIAPREQPRVAPREEPKLVLLREEPPEELREELEELPEKGIPRVPVEEPRVVMLHEPPRTVEPAPRNRESAPTNGAAGKSTSERVERGPVVLKGLRAPAEAPPRRRTRDVPDLLRPAAEPKPPSPREVSRPPAPAAPAASRASQVEPKAPAAPPPRVPPQGVEPRARAEAARVDPPKNGASRSELPRGDLPKGDLAPTWRKFLDRLTSTFDARPTPAAEPPRA